MCQATRRFNKYLTATLWRKMMSHGDIKLLAQDSTARKWWSQDSTRVWVQSMCS